MIEIAAGFQGSFDSVFASAGERIGNLKKKLSELDLTSKSVSSLKELQTATEQFKSKVEEAQKVIPGLKDSLAAATQAQELQKRKTAELRTEVEKDLGVLKDAKAKEAALKDEVRGLSAAKAEQKTRFKEAKAELKALGEAFEQSKAAYWNHGEATKQATLASKLNAEQMAVESSRTSNLKAELNKSLQTYEAAKKKLPEYKAAVERANTALSEQKVLVANATGGIKSLNQSYASSKTALAGHKAAVEVDNKALAQNGQHVDQLKAKLDNAETELKESAAAFEKQTAALKSYERALESAGHEVRDLARLESHLAQETARTQRSHDLASRRKKTADRGRELRGDIVGGAFELTGLALTLGTPIKIAAEFDHAMAKVGAQTMATAEEMKALTQEARRLGDTTVFSSSEAALAESYLATAGFGVQDIVDSLKGVLDLAAAGEVGLGEAAEMASNMLAGFKLDATDMLRVANVMTSTFISTNTNLTGLAETMKYVAPIASALGASIEEVSAASGLLGNVGLQGSMAGTALRAMYQRLSSPPAAGREALKQLNVTLRDAHKNLLPLPNILEQLDKKLAGKGTAERAKYIKDIFGEEAAAGATELLSAAGSGSLKFEIKKLEMAPAFRASLKYLQDSMTSADLKVLEDRFGVAFKEGMSKSARISELSKAFSGLKGTDFEKRFGEIFRFTPTLDKMELDLDTRAAQAKLKELKIDRLGGDKKDKSFDQLTKEVEVALAALPEPKRLEAMSVLFSRSKNEMRVLMQEAAQGEPKFRQLTDALEKTNSAQEISERLNNTAIGSWKSLQSSVEAVAISAGTIFLPKLSEMMKVLADGALKVSGMATEHENLVAAIGYFGAALAVSKAAMISYKAVLWALSGALEIITFAQTALNIVMNMNPVVATLTGMLLLITAMWAAIKNWDSVMQWLKDAKKWIALFWEEDLKPIMKSIGEFLSFGETRDLKFSRKIELEESRQAFQSRIPEISQRTLQEDRNRNQTFNVQQKFDISVQGEDAPQQTVTRIKDEMKTGFKSSVFSYADPLSF
ncbi:MAG TPA: phage tail tape measure protein [Oligoflexus sp.]|uniref:phage tail tape measure protein n=1 Tax=Oligoflexus sp. TaxID=1971216 RepID=UPI002D2BF0A1|nr:phage tail tape measure protein [Oligoflexus sp.]HYX39743.1 phage tail tape measure protein [Oligoflexus sp.]